MTKAYTFTLAVLILVTGTVFASAQSGVRVITPILTIDSERLYAGSSFGARVASEMEADQSVLLAENRKIEAELAAEEKELTEQRKNMTPEDFRAVADAFDRRVQDIRRIQDTKARSIGERREQEQAVFVQAARPVLVELMQEAGASVILERRSILASNDSIDITEQAIARLNAAIGDGAQLQRDP
ncbi:OmpH family outer membrane protein [Shimia thalassica]|uniref:OmpH family outer membrane protein n=1 Tax=Shimia thalassica TaxID=1715693 RepID=UPI002734DE67|nr:OmpH family outer membrane protein [Shimia thalassica]MDP2494889.1 OmpH family outer membrane protein [Shimia thalassica]